MTRTRTQINAPNFILIWKINLKLRRYIVFHVFTSTYIVVFTRFIACFFYLNVDYIVFGVILYANFFLNGYLFIGYVILLL